MKLFETILLENPIIRHIEIKRTKNDIPVAFECFVLPYFKLLY